MKVSCLTVVLTATPAIPVFRSVAAMSILVSARVSGPTRELDHCMVAQTAKQTSFSLTADLMI
jgi:hypothetical protein